MVTLLRRLEPQRFGRVEVAAVEGVPALLHICGSDVRTGQQDEDGSKQDERQAHDHLHQEISSQDARDVPVHSPTTPRAG